MAALLGFGLYSLVRVRHPRMPVLPPAPPGELGVSASAVPAGEWNAKVDAATDGLRPLSGFGRLRLTEGVLMFVPDGSAAAVCQVPAREIRAGLHPALARAQLWLIEPAVGQLDVSVSRKHLNRLAENDLKRLRENRYADEFRYALHGAGATIER